MATGAPIRPSQIRRRQFQELAVDAIDRQAAAVAQIGQDVEALKVKAQAQGEVIADLAVARDNGQQALAALEVSTKLDVAELRGRLTAFWSMSFWQRLRWLVTGR